MKTRILYSQYLQGYLDRQSNQIQAVVPQDGVPYIESQIAYTMGLLDGKSESPNFLEQHFFLKGFELLISDSALRDSPVEEYEMYLDAIRGNLNPAFFHVTQEADRLNAAKIIGFYERELQPYSQLRKIIDSHVLGKMDDEGSVEDINTPT